MGGEGRGFRGGKGGITSNHNSLLTFLSNDDSSLTFLSFHFFIFMSIITYIQLFLKGSRHDRPRYRFYQVIFILMCLQSLKVSVTS